MEMRAKFCMLDMKEWPLDPKGLNQNSICIHCDSQSVIYLKKMKLVDVVKFHTRYNPTDMTTKLVSLGKFKHFLKE
jgi:hypothetical protein